MNIHNTFQFLTKDKNGHGTLWCTAEGIDTTLFRDFSQYILDSCNDPSVYLLREVETDLVYSFEKVATELLKMHKRTFEERMKNVQTGIYAKGVEK